MATHLYPFCIDVTPPLGDYVCGGLHDQAEGVDDPLELRGVVVESDAVRCAIAVVDYCYLCGKSYQRLLVAIAQGAGIPESHVTLHANHVHDAPLINEQVHATYEHTLAGVHNAVYFDHVIELTEQEIAKRCLGEGVWTEKVSFSAAPVHQFASARRIIDAEGQCHSRWSVLQHDTHLRDAPEGRIDPMLDQVNFHDRSGACVVSMNFYACHPQVSDGRRLWSADTIGVARRVFESENPGVLTMNFNGCGGDITAGKYSSVNRTRNRLVFGVRLYDAMQAAFDRKRPEPIERINWHQHSFSMPLRQEDGIDTHKAVLDDPAASSFRKYLAGLKFLRISESITAYPFVLSALAINDGVMFFLPAEMCVDYQLYAKHLLQGPVAVAAYGDCFLNYVATDEAFEQGGYETRPDWTEVSPGSEGLIKKAISEAVVALHGDKCHDWEI